MDIFAFQDYRVGELVTAFARLKLLEMRELAKEQFRMNIVYGDTDSFFVSSLKNEEYDCELVGSFVAACKQNLGVEVDHQNPFVRSILVRTMWLVVYIVQLFIHVNSYTNLCLCKSSSKSSVIFAALDLRVYGDVTE